MNRDHGISLGFILNIVLSVALLLSLRGFVSDARNTFRYGGVDLRNRVVGARLMLEGLDPYTFKWSEEYPGTLLDPVDNPESEVSRVSVPPTVLMLHTPLAELPYRYQRIIWLLLQWILLLASVFLLARCADSRHEVKLVWITGLFLSGSPIWRLHVERGQIYILYVFVIALSFWMAHKQQRYATWLGGMALGLAVSLRPTLIFLCLPLLIFKKWRLLGGAMIGLLFMLSTVTLIFGTPVWASYISAMRYHEIGDLGIAQSQNTGFYESNVEGMDNLQRYMPFPNINNSVQWFFKGTFDIYLNSTLLLVMAGVVIILMTLYVARFRGRSASLATIYLAGYVIALTSDYFLPAIKAYYCNALWLIPFSMVALNSEKLSRFNDRQKGVAIFLLLSGLIFSSSILMGSRDVLLGEFLIMLFFVCMCANFLRLSTSATEPISEA